MGPRLREVGSVPAAPSWWRAGIPAQGGLLSHPSLGTSPTGRLCKPASCVSPRCRSPSWGTPSAQRSGRPRLWAPNAPEPVPSPGNPSSVSGKRGSESETHFQRRRWERCRPSPGVFDSCRIAVIRARRPGRARQRREHGSLEARPPWASVPWSVNRDRIPSAEQGCWHAITTEGNGRLYV